MNQLFEAPPDDLILPIYPKTGEWCWAAYSDIGGSGQNPECADMDNPQGYLYARFWVIEATNSIGERFTHPRTYDEAEVAQSIAEFFDAYGCVPGQDDHFGEPVYGSIAYRRDGCESDWAWRERHEFAF